MHILQVQFSIQTLGEENILPAEMLINNWFILLLTRRGLGDTFPEQGLSGCIYSFLVS